MSRFFENLIQLAETAKKAPKRNRECWYRNKRGPPSDKRQAVESENIK